VTRGEEGTSLSDFTNRTRTGRNELRDAPPQKKGTENEQYEKADGRNENQNTPPGQSNEVSPIKQNEGEKQARENNNNRKRGRKIEMDWLPDRRGVWPLVLTGETTRGEGENSPATINAHSVKTMIAGRYEKKQGS